MEVRDHPNHPNIPYEALSWCWGKAKWTEPIQIKDGGRPQTLNVLPNLKKALVALRHKSKRRILWVDAICIDQNNPIEKSLQVPMMAHIYGNALRVLVWLGDGDLHSQRALNFVNTKLLRFREFDHLREDPETAEKWESFIRLMRRPWFSRRWVIQEIAMAKEGIMQCGAHSIRWEDFADAVSLFIEMDKKTRRYSRTVIDTLAAPHLVDVISKLFQRTDSGEQQRALSLEYLVFNLSPFETTDPRDTVYALLSLAKDVLRQTDQRPELNEASPAIRRTARTNSNLSAQSYPVDYKQSTLSVYRHFMEYCIRRSERTRAMDIICRPWAPCPSFSPASPECPKLPSWIMSLDEAPFRSDLGHDIYTATPRKNADPLVSMPGKDHQSYSAAGVLPWTEWRFQERQDSYSMLVNGFVVDEVSEVTEPALLGNIPAEWCSAAGWTDPGYDEPPEAFWKTLIADGGPQGRAPRHYRRACKDAFHGLYPGQDLSSSAIVSETPNSAIADFLRRVQATTWNRCLCRTKRGRIGLVHRNTKEGDLVCILYGCSVPVVFRKFKKPQEEVQADGKPDPPRAQYNATGDNEWYYELIGPCYLHGMMGGEAIAFKNEQGITNKTFDIR
ncbi:HET-domain-containing protein [Lepidopterella palustris CBS 459.81]|uniref:HET-domain-containing protein n=1 Tax=Lepidopterella palustris CBS 459.81 TaxID=1314670 RepID=A0A8E2JB40_9PEZI|nr:HET-domain-containing protein [Lepidopterella palustris CBS 459.81]